MFGLNMLHSCTALTPPPSYCVSTEQQTSMATTVAVSPSEYLQPATAATQVSSNGICTFVSLLKTLQASRYSLATKDKKYKQHSDTVGSTTVFG